ncbi:MAG TPA: hypothetical protein VE860_26265, partial [Chthoniobacterales bacterium]|nr:hypothetical protein [Chthoniobacterales bacterium]
APVIAAANEAVVAANMSAAEVVAIGNEFSPADRLMNLVRRGAAIAGSSGARWDDRVPIAGATDSPIQNELQRPIRPKTRIGSKSVNIC